MPPATCSSRRAGAAFLAALLLAAPASGGEPGQAVIDAAMENDDFTGCVEGDVQSAATGTACIWAIAHARGLVEAHADDPAALPYAQIVEMLAMKHAMLNLAARDRMEEACTLVPDLRLDAIRLGAAMQTAGDTRMATALTRDRTQIEAVAFQCAMAEH